LIRNLGEGQSEKILPTIALQSLEIDHMDAKLSLA